jgi:hypothetical protein
MSLWSDFLDHDGHVVYKWKHYFPAYEAHFSRFVNRPVTMLEIGVSAGGSLQLWKKFFGPHAQIVGIDIDPGCTGLQEDQIAVRIGNQSDSAFLASILDEFGQLDIVLDDGSHRMGDIRASFDFLYPRLSPTGVYFVEDLHAAYWADYEGGLRREGTFVEFAKSLIDELNGDWHEGGNGVSDFTRATLSMHFYDSCVVFERGRHLEKSAPRHGRDPD